MSSGCSSSRSSPHSIRRTATSVLPSPGRDTSRATLWSGALGSGDAAIVGLPVRRNGMYSTRKLGT